MPKQQGCALAASNKQNSHLSHGTIGQSIMISKTMVEQLLHIFGWLNCMLLSVV